MLRPLAVALALLAIAGARGRRPAAGRGDLRHRQHRGHHRPATTRAWTTASKGFARRVERIIDDGGGRPRGSELLDGVFFGDASSTFERSRRFDVDRVDRRRAARHRRDDPAPLPPAVRAHLRPPPPRRPDVDAVELEVPGVSARALREGLLADQEARERLFGGSVTLDRHLLLVAAPRGRPVRPRLRQAHRRRPASAPRPSYGEREFVEVATDGRARIEKRTLHITGTPADDRLALHEGRRLEIDFGDDGVIDFEPSRHRFDRVRIDLGDGGDDTLVRQGSPADDRIELEARELAGVERVEVEAGDGDDRVTVEDLYATGVWQVKADLGAADGDLDRVAVEDSDEGNQTSVSGLRRRRERAGGRLDDDRRRRADRPPARQRQRRRRHRQRLDRRDDAHARRRRRRQRDPRRPRRRHADRRRRLRRHQGRPR